MRKAFENAINQFVTEAGYALGELCEELDELEEDQAERETEARQEKIDELADRIALLETALVAVEALY